MKHSKQKSLTIHNTPVSHVKGAGKLLEDIRLLINKAREEVAHTVDRGLVHLNWSIGRRIRVDILREKRAAYGEEIVSTLSRQLGWSHFKEIIYMNDQLKREYYAEMCRLERWSVRTLRQKIGSILFERTALSKKPVKLANIELKKLREEDRLTPDLVFRDPYFLEFLGLKGAYQEKDVEEAIIREMEAFILELGVGFSFVARQKRMQIGPDDFYLDLLFYHRKLRRRVGTRCRD